MTRQEFIDNVTYWAELCDFCYDENIGYCDDVFNEDSYNECIRCNLQDMTRGDFWQDIRDWLYELPSGYDYYIQDDHGDWRGADDDDFDIKKGAIIQYMDDEGLWDEDEEEPEEYYDVEDETPIEDEDISLAELFIASNNKVRKIEDDRAAEIAADLEEKAAFDEFLKGVDLATVFDIAVTA